MIGYLLAFVFPASAFFGGAYLIFRGLSLPARSFARGQARAERAVRSHLDGRDVVYSRLSVEYFTGRSPEWKEVYSSERKGPFRLSGRPVSPDFAHFRLSNPKVVQGFVPVEGGLLSSIEGLLEFTGYEKGGPIGAGLRSLLGRDRAFIDLGTLKRLSEDPKAGKAVARQKSKFLRISEFSVPQGSKLSVASAYPDLRGTVAHPLLITDAPIEGARSDMEEKARFSLLLGAGLVIFSFVAASALFHSL